MVLEHGGSAVWTFSDSITHYIHRSFIFSSVEGHKLEERFRDFRLARMKRKKIVSPWWLIKVHSFLLFKSCEAGNLLVESDFPHVYDPMKTLSFGPPSFSDDDNDFSLSKSRIDPDIEKKDSPFIDLIDNILSTTHRQKPSGLNASVDDGQVHLSSHRQDLLKRLYSTNRGNETTPDCEKENQDVVTFDALDNGLLGRDKTLRAILNKNHYIS